LIQTHSLRGGPAVAPATSRRRPPSSPGSSGRSRRRAGRFATAPWTGDSLANPSRIKSMSIERQGSPAEPRSVLALERDPDGEITEVVTPPPQAQRRTLKSYFMMGPVDCVWVTHEWSHSTAPQAARPPLGRRMPAFSPTARSADGTGSFCCSNHSQA
jgi:hypothetical protein